MARMNSKYFSAVINKILALKRQEQIVPDEALRERLREGILARAAEMKQPQGAGFDMAGVKEFLYRFRYAFGAVPAVLVVVLVAVQISQLPFEAGSETDVHDEGSASLIMQMATDEVGSMDDTKMPEKKIQTFAGADVLPRDFKRPSDGDALLPCPEQESQEETQESLEGAKEVKENGQSQEPGCSP